MKRKALFVGVNTYEDEQIRDLDFSLSDAHALKTMFELFGFESDILENPSKSDVFHAVRQMTADLTAGDLFFFYFAGHGWTTTSGKHLLFCSDDLYEDLRDDDAGISFDKLKRKTTGDYNRAFVLDACRSDFITGTRGGDTTTRDLRPIGELVKDAPAKSSLAVLRSCSQYEHALEIRSRKHGLFTLAMMEVLRTSKDCGSELMFGEALCDAVTDKMLYIAKAEGITAEQTPEFAKSGLAQVLIEGSRTAIPSMAMPTAGAQNFVVCPICGRHALITETFKCKICGKDYICSNHFFAEYNCCEACAEKKINTKKALKAYNDADYDLAYELMQKGDDACPEGQFVMAGLYGNGCRYLDEDSDKATEWLRKAAEQGSADAQFELANHYHSGYSVGKNPSEAYNWYMKAARQGHVEAQDFVGWCYETGFGVDEDADSAFLWYQRAAERGWASAQCSLGRLYANGEGAEEDAEEAVKWYRKAAEQGDDEAQYYLGECYYRGDGVEESEDEAIKWYRLAADQGNEDAQERLDELDPQETEDNGSVEESDDEERTVERDDADAMKRKTLPLRLDEAFPTENCVEVNLVEGGVSGGDRFGRYCGPMENGKPHGTGRFMSSSGYVYTGVFFNGVRSGRGKIEYKDGATYEGGFYEGEWSGEGTYTWPNGTQHVGQFRNGKFHGPGRQINPDGTSFTGNWEYGKLIAYT